MCIRDRAGIVSIGLIGCGNSAGSSNDSSSNGDDKVIKVGVSPVPHEEIMEVAKPLLEAKGYTVEIVEFTDYVLPNTALESGEIDANYFQHIAYLNSFNADNGTHLTYTDVYKRQVFNLAAVGVLLNISRQTKSHKDEIQEKIIKSKMNV